GEVIVDQRGANAGDLVRADRRASTTAADRDSALDLAGRHGSGERRDEVRIVVVRVEDVRAEIDDLVSGRAQARDQILLQSESTVIGGDSYTPLHSPRVTPTPSSGCASLREARRSSSLLSVPKYLARTRRRRSRPSAPDRRCATPLPRSPREQRGCDRLASRLQGPARTHPSRPREGAGSRPFRHSRRPSPRPARSRL